MSYTIRQETNGDRAAVYEVVRRAFEHAEHTDHDEHNLVERLRGSRAFIPELSLVAEEGGAIVGHILFTRVRVGEGEALALAPLAVAPHMQGRGVGGALIRAGHARARELGYRFCILLGHAGYYPRFGYRPASGFGIRAPFEVDDASFMAVDLIGADGRLTGTVQYTEEFGIG